METLAYVLMVIFFCLALTVVLALPTMWLWNWLMPALFGLTKIGFLQALGLNCLCAILFKSTGSVSQ